LALYLLRALKTNPDNKIQTGLFVLWLLPALHNAIGTVAVAIGTVVVARLEQCLVLRQFVLVVWC
jgi:hypothetical protein